MDVREFLKDNIILLDGAMGTQLFARGLKPGERPETWNVSRFEDVKAVHKSYFDAGANIVCTNTFGANALKFAEDELDALIGAAVAAARAAASESSGTQAKFVSLDVGPTGKLLKPYGDLDFEDAVAIFAKTIKLGVKYGVDLIYIETMSDSYETKAAVLAAKENCSLPVFVSNAYGEDGKLMTGADPSAMVAMLEGMGVDALGANCSLGPKQLMGVVDELLARASVPVLFKPNAGLPVDRDGVTEYDVSPDEFARVVAEALEKGVRVAGGCCGTTPEYIAALEGRAARLNAKAITDKNITCVSSYTHAVDFCSPVLIGERINPTGKKRFKQALIENDLDYVLNEGISQQQKGVHILDVNVGIPDVDETAWLVRATCGLQAIIDLPLQIDTADGAAMEAALRRYNGKAMINSVNGKKSSMDTVFPLVKKYGGLVVALTLDEDGIPSTAEGRVEIAKKILVEAQRYGIAKKDIIFDTLAMTVSADNTAAVATLKALKMIKEELGCHTSLGVSNVSFGLPQRDVINSTFFAMALTSGLSAAIMNPHSAEMMRTFVTFTTLSGRDENCMKYIDFASTYAYAATQPQTASTVIPDGKSELVGAIVRGLKDKAGELTKALLLSVPPLDVVQNDVIPALDEVGKGFEEKRVYLPQLLMSAEAAKSAFNEIKAFMSAKSEQKISRSKVVLATVHGDIHDIGKNIVKLLLENYGFDVVDLGRDVPEAVIADEVVRLNAPIVGLSALMTTTVPAMAKTIELIKAKAPFAKVIVGGAVLNAEYAAKIGAHYYAKDAMETVRIAEKIEKN